VDDLRIWLRGRGIKTGFFFPEDTDSADYLNPTDLHYAPKLAAAISAWEAVKKDPLAMRGKTAKQAIVIWLRRHADRYGLTKEDGSPNEQGIEEVSIDEGYELRLPAKVGTSEVGDTPGVHFTTTTPTPTAKRCWTACTRHLGVLA
jgi:hypothetical protein